jgi:RNA polymerase sigma factor FliA
VEAISRTLGRTIKLPPCINIEDLKSWGLEGLIKAKEKFKPNKNCKFKTYAYYRIKGEILDGIRKEWSYRNPMGHKKFYENIEDKIADVVQSILETENEEPVALALTNKEQREKLHNLVNTSAMVYLLSMEELKETTPSKKNFEINYDRILLSDEINSLAADEQQIIKMFYYEGFPQSEIAQKLHLSKSKVCRIHKKILNKLRVNLEETITN